MSKLTESSRGSTCIKCGYPESFSAHYNGKRSLSFGKGRGIKCNDLMTAEFCYKCDQEFSEGSMLPRWNNNGWERSEEFLHLCMMTNIRRFNDGELK